MNYKKIVLLKNDISNIPALKIYNIDKIELLMVEEFAEKLCVKTTTITKWCREKKITHIKLGKRYFIADFEIDRILKKALEREEI